MTTRFSFLCGTEGRNQESRSEPTKEDEEDPVTHREEGE